VTAHHQRHAGRPAGCGRHVFDFPQHLSILLKDFLFFPVKPPRRFLRARSPLASSLARMCRLKPRNWAFSSALPREFADPTEAVRKPFFPDPTAS
jgi:hypothetical protein